MADERDASVALLDDTVQLAKSLKSMYGRSGEHLKNLQSINGNGAATIDIFTRALVIAFCFMLFSSFYATT